MDSIVYNRLSTAPIRLAEEPTTSRPNVGASSLFDNITVETEKTQQLEQGSEKTAKKQVRIIFFSQLCFEWLVFNKLIIVSMVFSEYENESTKVKYACTTNPKFACG